MATMVCEPSTQITTFQIQKKGKKDKTCITPLEKRIPILKASRETRNFQTLQQSLCVCLLSEFCDITIKQPAKKSVVTQQYMRLKSLDFGNGEVIFLSEYLKRRCLELKQDDIDHDVSIKTATRRFQNNKRIELLHLLIDLLIIRGGYEFESKYAEGKAGINKQESIKKVIRDNRIIVEGDRLTEKAEEVNMVISRRLAMTKKELIIRKGDPIIQILFE
ncbi:hypothetical protein ENUP19_0253G0045 [Entamoeba nuttalli]|uniref:TATA-binding protein-associated phosphoprotein n=1 Tax=Entamoeba nuttalli TaxID=412467 RepID=A0ABQ0DRJ6_9EUKA